MANGFMNLERFDNFLVCPTVDQCYVSFIFFSLLLTPASFFLFSSNDEIADIFGHAVNGTLSATKTSYVTGTTVRTNIQSFNRSQITMNGGVDESGSIVKKYQMEFSKNYSILVALSNQSTKACFFFLDVVYTMRGT